MTTEGRSGGPISSAAAAAGWRVQDTVLVKASARLRARRMLVEPIVIVVLRKHYDQHLTPAQIAAWLASHCCGPDNPAASEDFVRFVLAAVGPNPRLPGTRG